MEYFVGRQGWRWVPESGLSSTLLPDLIQKLEVALSSYPRRRQIRADVGYGNLARTRFDHNGARNAGFSHDDVVALLPADHEPVELEGPNQNPTIDRNDFRQPQPLTG
jgi:hypothetical protein